MHYGGPAAREGLVQLKTFRQHDDIQGHKLFASRAFSKTILCPSIGPVRTSVIAAKYSSGRGEILWM